jgi:hypothetical protein
MNSTDLITRALRYGVILTVAILVIGSIVGYLLGGVEGLVSALVGTGVTAVFMGVTTLSFVVAARVAKLPEGIVVYYGIILGTFFLKLVIFLILILALRSAPWLNPTIFGFTIIAAVLGTLIVDVLAMQRGRVAYVDVSLPGDNGGATGKSPEDS